MCAYTLYTFKVSKLLNFMLFSLVQFPETCVILPSFLFFFGKLEVSDAFY